MNHHSRLRLRALFTALALVSTAPVAAHEGAHTPDMLVRVEAAAVSGNEVQLSLTMTGLGAPLVLTGLQANGAILPAVEPIPVPFAQDVPIVTIARFASDPPGLFTLNLNFGPSGQGAVVVIPDPETEQ